MRAITVRQPWAWAVVHGQKSVENRSRNIAGSYRGPVAIHAGLMGADFDAAHPDLWPLDERHVTGAIIGVVDLVDVHADCTEIVMGYGETPICSPWAQSGHHHLILANPRPLPEPIPYRGALGLWTLPFDCEEN